MSGVSQFIKDKRAILYKYQDLRAFAEKSHDDAFCSLCWRATDPGDYSTCCHWPVFDREHILRAMNNRIGVLSEEIKEVLGHEDVRPPAPPEEEKVVGTKVNRPQAPVTPGGDTITVVYSNGQRTFADDHKARKWLRDKGLSVRDAEKIGNTWKFADKIA